MTTRQTRCRAKSARHISSAKTRIERKREKLNSMTNWEMTYYKCRIAFAAIGEMLRTIGIWLLHWLR